MSGGILGGGAPQGSGILGGLHDYVTQNRGALMGLGGGLLSGDFGAATQGFQQGMAQDERTRLIQRKQAEEEQQKVALQQAAQKLGIDPVLAQASPELIGAVAQRKYTPKEYSLQDQWLRDKAKQDPAFLDTYFGSQLGPKPTDDLREYQVAKAQGYTGSFMDYQTALKKAGAQSISIDQKAESTEEVERAKANTKYLSDLSAQSGTIARRSADLDFLGRVVSKTNSGSGADTRAMFDGIGQSLGMSPGTLKTQADAIKAVTNRIAPTLRAEGSGSQSDAELAGFLSALPNLTASPQGNQLIQATLQRAAKIDRERTKVASQFSAGRITATEARQKIAELDEQSIYASEEEKKLIDNAMGFAPLSGGEKGAKGWKILGWE